MAQSHGLPVVADDNAYGPSDIIEDDFSGKLVKDGDYKAFAKALIALMENQDTLQKYSDNAYVSRERFSEKAIWKAWQQLITDADRFFSEDLKNGEAK